MIDEQLQIGLTFRDISSKQNKFLFNTRRHFLKK